MIKCEVYLTLFGLFIDYNYRKYGNSFNLNEIIKKFSTHFGLVLLVSLVYLV